MPLGRRDDVLRHDFQQVDGAIIDRSIGIFMVISAIGTRLCFAKAMSAIPGARFALSASYVGFAIFSRERSICRFPPTPPARRSLMCAYADVNRRRNGFRPPMSCEYSCLSVRHAALLLRQRIAAISSEFRDTRRERKSRWMS